MSDTPRTEYACMCGLDAKETRNFEEADWVRANFARELERELSAAMQRHIERDALDLEQAQATARLVAERDRFHFALTCIAMNISGDTPAQVIAGNALVPEPAAQTPPPD